MLEILILILFLIIINGIFSMSEIAIISSRKSSLEELAKRGNKSSKTAINLIESPNKFLSTIQIGINTIAILLGVFSGTEISIQLEIIFKNIGIPEQYAFNLAITITVIIITYISIVVGELVPKRIALSNPEGISLIFARPMYLISKISTPLVWLLSVSTDLIVKLFNISSKKNLLVTEHEIKAMIEEGTNSGEIQEIEQDIVERVFHLGDQQIGAIMTNRNNIVWLNINDDFETNKEIINTTTHSIYPVCDDELDKIIGIVYVKDLFKSFTNYELSKDLRKFIRPANIFPVSQKAYFVLERFKESKIHFGMAVDEFGITEGIVTLNDILDALVGDITESTEPEILQINEKSWMLDGKLAFFEFLHEFEIEDNETQENFHSIGGFFINQLNSIPKQGDNFIWNGYKFEIHQMDGNRINKILISKID